MSPHTLWAAFRGDSWASWARLRTRAKGGAGRYVDLVVGGRKVTRSVEVLRRAAFSADPASCAAAIAGTGPDPKPARTPRETPPRVLPPVAPPCPLGPPDGAGEGPRPVAVRAPFRLEAEPLEVDELQARGERHGRARLEALELLEAKRLRGDGWTFRELARRYGVAPGTIRYAVRGETWGHVTAE